MKRNIKDLLGFAIETVDEEKATAQDVLFDEELWVVRYLEADFGNLFKSRRVLIPKSFLEMPNWEMKNFPIELRKADIEMCPRLENHLPVSRKYEEELFKHYEILPYWTSAQAGALGMYYPPRPLKVPHQVVDEEDIDSRLRSYNEVTGYKINALDGSFGHVTDMIVDDSEWQILYLVIDTKNWVPWSRKVIIPIDFTDEISYENREISINLHTETIKNSPEYKSAESISRELEEAFYDFYSRNLVK